MKKIKYFLLVIGLCLFISGCSSDSKTVISTSDFQTIGSNNGFTVEDNMDSYKNLDYIKEAVKIELDSISTLELVVYNDVDSAKEAQDNINDNYNYLKGTTSASYKYKGNNYYKYILIANNFYMVSARVDNTLFFCKTSITNKEKVEKLIEDMGY